MKRILLIAILTFQFNFGQTPQNPLGVGSLQITNDEVYNSSINSGGVARIDMGFDGVKGYVKFGAHTGGGQRDDILYMRGNDGNVGIGTQNPLATLDVYSPITTQDIYNNAQVWSTGYPDYNLKLRTIWNTHGINQEFIQRFNGVDYKSLVFYSGNVGIGTGVPDSKLTVKGTIHSTEVKVDLNVPAPDYVFASDYKLRSLQEVENYVNQNSHLPEIPSAQEFEKNGIQLAEMNMALLKKIEELTLYAIDQQKNTEKLNICLLEQQKKSDQLNLYIIEQNKRLEKLEKENLKLHQQ